MVIILINNQCTNIQINNQICIFISVLYYNIIIIILLIDGTANFAVDTNSINIYWVTESITVFICWPTVTNWILYL